VKHKPGDLPFLDRIMLFGIKEDCTAAPFFQSFLLKKGFRRPIVMDGFFTLIFTG